MRWLCWLLLPLVVSLAPVPRTAETDDPMAPLRRLVGRWEGTSDGSFGAAKLEREYELLFGGRFLQARTRSVSAAEVHEDLGILSFDQDRGVHVLREFHSEGYVNRYVLEILDDGDTLVFETEAVENGFAPGLRARSVITIEGEDALHETLELATGENPWRLCVEMDLVRAEAGD